MATTSPRPFTIGPPRKATLSGTVCCTPTSDWSMTRPGLTATPLAAEAFGRPDGVAHDPGQRLVVGPRQGLETTSGQDEQRQVALGVPAVEVRPRRTRHRSGR